MPRQWSGAWLAAGGYDPIVEQVFGLDCDRLPLEYDTERAGTFEPLRLVPPDKVVVLGLVSTKTPVLKSADDLLRRIDDWIRLHANYAWHRHADAARESDPCPRHAGRQAQRAT